jgi:hypothetical protein
MRKEVSGTRLKKRKAASADMQPRSAAADHPRQEESWRTTDRIETVLTEDLLSVFPKVNRTVD